MINKKKLLFDSDEQVAGAHASSNPDHEHGHDGKDHSHNSKDHGHNHNGHDHKSNEHHHFDRCQELVFDAAIENKEGVHYFFKGR